MKINWKQKLTSRKFWLAVIGFVTAVLIFFRVSDSAIAEVTSIITAFGTLVAYIIGESVVDASRTTTSEEEEKQ